jgi:hypothetical protein
MYPSVSAVVFNFFAQAVATVGANHSSSVPRNVPMNSRRFGGREFGKGHANQVSDADMCVPGSAKECHVARVCTFQRAAFTIWVKTTAFDLDMNIGFKRIFVVLIGFVCAC